MCVCFVYIPAIGADNRAVSHDVLITKYFNLGLEYAEILAFLVIYHGITLSIRQLKRILKRNNLIGSGSCLGYKKMHHLIRRKHGLVIQRETVRLFLKELDTEGVDRRSRHRLQRREYFAKRPNYIYGTWMNMINLSLSDFAFMVQLMVTVADCSGLK